MKTLISILLLGMIAAAQQTGISDYGLALTGELSACRKYMAECEAQQRDFALRCQERERAAQKEILRLKNELQHLQAQKQALLKQKQNIDAECVGQKNELKLLEAPLSTAEQNLEKQKAYLPYQLRETLLPPLQGDDIAARLTRYLDTIAAIEDFSQNAQRPFPQKIQVAENTVQEYQVLMCGLSLALAYSDARHNAGIGVRNGETWRWTWNKDWYRQIRKAADICSGARPPELLALPVIEVVNAGGNQ